MRWVCDIRMGQAPDTPGGPAPPQSAVVPPPMGAGRAVAAGSRKFKLSAILDPTLEAEEPRSWTRIIVQSSGTFQRDSDISPDQLAAVAQVIKTGAVSFADFISLFVPRPASPKVPDLHRLQPVDRYGGMAEERATGPHGLKHTWYQCYIRCSAPACCCLEAADAERLDARGGHIRSSPRLTRGSDRNSWKGIRRELRTDPQFGFQN